MTVHTAYLTKQRRIPASAVTADVTIGSGAALHVAIAIDSDVRQRFPDDYEIITEAYTRGRSELLACGTVGDPDTTPADISGTFPGTSGVRLRVMIVDKHGRIAGACDGITPKDKDHDDGPRLEGFLRIEEDDLGPRPFKIATDELHGPTLHVHTDVIRASGSRATWIQAPATKAYILPMVCETALRWASQLELEDGDPATATARNWLRWAQLLAPADERPDDPDDLDPWVATVTDAFCRSHHFTDELTSDLETE